jgi:hypothetical protein
MIHDEIFEAVKEWPLVKSHLIPQQEFRGGAAPGFHYLPESKASHSNAGQLPNYQSLLHEKTG